MFDLMGSDATFMLDQEFVFRYIYVALSLLNTVHTDRYIWEITCLKVFLLHYVCIIM